MIKQFLISSLPLLTIAFLLTGCEKTKSAPEKKNQVEESVPEEKTPSTETMTEIKEVEITGNKKMSVTAGDPVKTDDQKFEGSRSLKRYLDDSP